MCAAKIAPTDSRVVAWNDGLSAVLGALTTPEAFLKGELPPEVSEIGYYSFVNFLMSNGKAYPKLIEALQKGTKFEPAFSAAYGGSPDQLAALWVKKPPPKPTRAPSKTSTKKTVADK